MLRFNKIQNESKTREIEREKEEDKYMIKNVIDREQK